MKTVLAAAVALVALQVPASAQFYGNGGGNPAGAIVGAVVGGLLGAGGGIGRPVYGGYGGGYGGGYAQAGYPAFGGGYGGNCRIVVRRGLDDWGNPVAIRQRRCL